MHVHNNSRWVREMSRKLQWHRWVVQVTRRHARKDSANGVIARRLLKGIPPTPETITPWLDDLRHMVKLAWAISPDGERYLGSLTEQCAANALTEVIDAIDAQAFVDRMREERSA